MIVPKLKNGEFILNVVVKVQFTTSIGDTDDAQFLLREGRSCVRYKCGLFNTVQDVLSQRPGWVEVKG